MARPAKKTIYERIDEKLNTIKETEEALAKLQEELQDLYKKRDQQEMERLFEQMRSNGLTIDKAIELLQTK